MFSVSTVFTALETHCIRGGGLNINLPSAAFYLHLENTVHKEIELSIFERNVDAAKGGFIFSATVVQHKYDQLLRRRFYTSSDRRIFLTINEREDGNVLSAMISETAESLDRRKLLLSRVDHVVDSGRKRALGAEWI